MFPTLFKRGFNYNQYKKYEKNQKAMSVLWTWHNVMFPWFFIEGISYEPLPISFGHFILHHINEKMGESQLVSKNS